MTVAPKSRLEVWAATSAEPPGNLNQLRKPPHRQLGDFIQQADPLDRTTLATSLVLTLWQVAGLNLSLRPPSFLLVQPWEDFDDPIDRVAGELATGLDDTLPSEKGEGRFADGTPEEAPAAMLKAFHSCVQLSQKPGDWDYKIRPHEERFHDARRVACGGGRVCAYSRAWHDEMGLMGAPGNEVILRIDTDEDRAAFLRDGVDHPERLSDPIGPGRRLQLQRKVMTLSGTLPSSHWDRRIAEGIVQGHRPFFFLPHLATKLPEEPPPLVLTVLNMSLSGRSGAPVLPAERLPDLPLARHYVDQLRARLGHLDRDYAFAIHSLLYELDEVCRIIVAVIAAGQPATREEVAALHGDLYLLTLRGLLIGTASLAWHVCGFDPGGERDIALEILDHLREQGPTSARDLQRKFRSLSAEQRSLMLTRLAAEGLARLEKIPGKRTVLVRASLFDEFVRSLHHRPEFVAPELLWPRVSEEA